MGEGVGDEGEGVGDEGEGEEKKSVSVDVGEVREEV